MTVICPSAHPHLNGRDWGNSGIKSTLGVQLVGTGNMTLASPSSSHACHFTSLHTPSAASIPTAKVCPASGLDGLYHGECDPGPLPLADAGCFHLWEGGIARLKRRAESSPCRSPQPFFQFLLVGFQRRIYANRRGLVGDPVDGGLSGLIGQTCSYPALPPVPFPPVVAYPISRPTPFNHMSPPSSVLTPHPHR